MTKLDTTLRQKAYDVIQEYGMDMVFHSNASDAGRGTYNPATGIYESVPTAVELTYKASPPVDYERAWRAGDNVQEGDVLVTLPALNLDATFEADALGVGMKVEIGDATFVAARVEKIYSGEEITAYNLQLRARRDK